MFDTVLIAGLGLMGGSMAKTIKARTLSRVLGWNRTRATAEQALADGSIDAIATEALYKEADLVIIGPTCPPRPSCPGAPPRGG